VDRILAGITPFAAGIGVLRQVVVREVLFHEIGHHIHHTVCPEHDDKEDDADSWEKKLSSVAIRRYYWYRMPIMISAASL